MDYSTTEYIDRDRAIAIIEEWQRDICPLGCRSRNKVYGTDRERFDALDAIIDEITAIPDADVKPVRHGKWECADDGDGVVCSVCGEDFCTLAYETERFKCCPNCGAKMDLTEASNDEKS